jgi:hypothetical protein
MFQLKNVAVLSLVLTITLIFTSGCGQENTGLQVDQEGNEITIRSNEGEVKLNGEVENLPEGFPLSAYPGAKIESSMTSSGENGVKYFVVALSSFEPIGELATFYEKELKDRGIQTERTDLKDDGKDSLNSVILNGKSDALEATVQIVRDESDTKTESYMLNLLVTKIK